MMTIGDVKQLMECSCGMPHGALPAAFLEVSGQLIETMTALEGHLSSSGELALQYQQMKEKADGYEEDNKRLNSLVNQLRQQILDLQDQLHLSRKDQFGRKTEQASALPENTADNKPEDPVEEEPGEVPETPHTRPVLPFPGKASRGKRKKGQRKKDLGNLPVKNEMIFDPAEIMKLYGPNFEIFKWETRDMVEYVPASLYIKREWRPVIAAGLCRDLIRMPVPAPLFRGSFVSPSLIAGIAYRKFTLALSVYRQEMEWVSAGITIRRQTMVNWLNNAAGMFLYPAYQYICGLFRGLGYSQCDETPVQVINDGRAAGSKSYFWHHTTSELATGVKLVAVYFELTRAAQHLFDFFGDDYGGVLMDDAYSAYFTFENASGGNVTVCCCNLHARRKFVKAFEVRRPDGMTNEQIEELPDFKVIRMYGEIYHIETALKELAPEARLERRQNEVRPVFDRMLKYVDSLDPETPAYSNYLSEAISYMQRHKEDLCSFLSDPMIPADNQYVERKIKTLPWEGAIIYFATAGMGRKQTPFTILWWKRQEQTEPIRTIS
ncbi:MAG: IS66 family transposase [Clostridiales bacterium]|nr:IS66 family transposase [Clostridiales bacterium]